MRRWPKFSSLTTSRAFDISSTRSDVPLLLVAERVWNSFDANLPMSWCWGLEHARDGWGCRVATDSYLQALIVLTGAGTPEKEQQVYEFVEKEFSLHRLEMRSSATSRRLSLRSKRRRTSRPCP